jgi:hypothetical protein
MRIFNEGVNKWRIFLEQNDTAIRLLTNLFRIFFYYEGLSSITADDKKFNFIFAATD